MNLVHKSYTETKTFKFQKNTFLHSRNSCKFNATTYRRLNPTLLIFVTDRYGSRKKYQFYPTTKRITHMFVEIKEKKIFNRLGSM